MTPGKPRVLVVEDDPHLGTIMGIHLSSHALSVKVVGDGLAALEAFDAEAPNVVTLDLNVPTISGFRLIKLFKRARPEVPVLIVTALDFVEAEEVARSGADDFVTKPFDPGVLAEKVWYHLRGAASPPGAN
jgi:DNA-binding response OmpR family regulator